MAEQSYNLKYTGKEIDDLLDKANNMDSSAQVPVGGTYGQVLTKKSRTDFDAEWKTPGVALPTGGTAEQILTKNSATDGDASWKDAPIALPDGGDSGQVLTKNSSTNGDASWKTPATPSNPLPVGGTTGQVLAKKSDTNYDTEWIDTGTSSFNPSPNAGAHNAIYRGKFLGNSVTEAQYAAISAGTFDDLYIGDYWTIGGVNYRIGAFNYFLHTGDIECTTNHVLLVPDTCLYNAPMNSTNTTDGGYVGSAMYKSNLKQANTIIKNAFSGHVLKHRIYLTNAVANGRASGGAMCDSEVDLMCEQMVYGSGIFSPVSDGSNAPVNYRVEKSQLPLFQHEPSRICNRTTWWLRDVITGYAFALVSSDGRAAHHLASTSDGVRPAFCIY